MINNREILLILFTISIFIILYFIPIEIPLGRPITQTENFKSSPVHLNVPSHHSTSSPVHLDIPKHHSQHHHHHKHHHSLRPHHQDSSSDKLNIVRQHGTFDELGPQQHNRAIMQRTHTQETPRDLDTVNVNVSVKNETPTPQVIVPAITTVPMTTARNFYDKEDIYIPLNENNDYEGCEYGYGDEDEDEEFESKKWKRENAEVRDWKNKKNKNKKFKDRSYNSCNMYKRGKRNWRDFYNQLNDPEQLLNENDPKNRDILGYTYTDPNRWKPCYGNPYKRN